MRRVLVLLTPLLVGWTLPVNRLQAETDPGQKADASAGAPIALRPDLTVAADGSGDFRTVQEAVASIPRDNRERVFVFVKEGVYLEKVRIDASYVTLRGESRKRTRIEYPQLAPDFERSPDSLGRAVINANGTDLVLENLTAANTAGVVGLHAFTIYSGRADRTVIMDCDILSDGADTVALWNSRAGRYYHARCHFRGAVDFLCPRGWCYITDSTFYETKSSAAVWHDGHSDKDMKFVIRRSSFDGVSGWYLARHHHDAQFYFLDCIFSRSMIDRVPFRVIYPLGDGPATPKDVARNEELNRSNVWGHRAYFYNAHHEGGDYAWHRDNLESAPGAPRPATITAAWTFDGRWDPESRVAPAVQRVRVEDGRYLVTFGEPVTVKGKPRLLLQGGTAALYASGSGTETLVFTATDGTQAEPRALDPGEGLIIASQAGAFVRVADTALPAAPRDSRR